MRSDDIMAPVKKALAEGYGLEKAGVAETQGGWSARAFRVEAEGSPYFLKVYDKEENSTAQWTRALGIYLPFLQKLEEGPLAGCVPHTIPSADGLWWEDERYLYLLADWISGETPAQKPLSEKQAASLGAILGKLHGYVLSDEERESFVPIREDFCVPFLEPLKKLAVKRGLPEDVAGPLESCREPLQRALEELTVLSGSLAGDEEGFVPCHTDIHGWNLLAGEGKLWLLDWEGLRYAPREADFFALTGMPHYPALWEAYCRELPGVSLDQERLAFYSLRRRCEDLWEFAARVLFDRLDEATRRASVAGLENECRALAARDKEERLCC